jgi:hypothetical protein
MPPVPEQYPGNLGVEWAVFGCNSYILHADFTSFQRQPPQIGLDQ